VLSSPQTSDGVGIGRVDEELKTAESLQGHDLARAKRVCGRPQRGVAFRLELASGIQEAQLRSTTRASDRLGVEAAIGRVVILGLAGGAQGEFGHRGSRPIVGQLPDDRPAWSAIRAIRERVAIARLPRVGDLFTAGRASGQVSRDRRPRRRIARHSANFKAGAGRGLSRERPQFLDLDRVDPRLSRGPAAQHFQEVGNCRRGASDFQTHSVGLVLDPADQAALAGGSIDKRAETDTLNDTANGNRHATRVRWLLNRPQYSS
jgi:hypothetical protein